MKIDIDFLDGQQFKASFGKFTLTSDQSIAVGGNEEFPEPFDYFLASMPLCAAFYIRKFCEQRDISTDGIKLSQSVQTLTDDKYKKTFTIAVTLPETFPTKYKKALLAAANSCTVKKVIQAQPDFDIKIVGEE